MEDVLDLYAEPYDPRRPKVNFDEKSVQLIAETRPALPGQPGQPTRIDYEYQRNGTANLLVFCEPQAGWRHLAVTERRTMQDFAPQMKWLVDERYPEAEVMRVVLDNLNTHFEFYQMSSKSGQRSAMVGGCLDHPIHPSLWPHRQYTWRRVRSTA